MTPSTEITLAGVGPRRVQGSLADIESEILAAARGSLMQLAWLTEAGTGERIGVNPDHVVMLRAVES